MAFPDEWREFSAASSTEFNSYDETTGLPLHLTRDIYTAPSATQAGGTPTFPADLGERIIWQLDRPTHSPITLTPIDSRPAHAGVRRLPGGDHVQQDGRHLQRPAGGARQTLPIDLASADHRPRRCTTLSLASRSGASLWNEGEQPASTSSCAPACAPVSPRPDAQSRSSIPTDFSAVERQATGQRLSAARPTSVHHRSRTSSGFSSHWTRPARTARTAFLQVSGHDVLDRAQPCRRRAHGSCRPHLIR